MRRTRQEELHTIQNLGLIRDERDWELQRSAQGLSCSALVVLSQLLAAACLLQRDPAWTALLSLTFVNWTVQNFSHFRADHTRLYLILGLLAGAAALVLLGWFLTFGQEHGLYSLGLLAAFALLAGILIPLAGLVFTALVLSALFLMAKLGRMNGEQWDQFFASASTLRLLEYLGGLMVLAMALIALGSVPLFAVLHFPAPERLALVLFAAGCARLFGKFSRRREKLLRLLLRFKLDQSSETPAEDGNAR